MSFFKVSSWYIGWPSTISMPESYYAALIEEINFFKKNQFSKMAIDTLFVECGLSFYEPLLLDTASILIRSEKINDGAELSVEIGCPAITDHALQALQIKGINRVTVTLEDCCQVYGESLRLVERANRLFGRVGLDVYIGCTHLANDWQRLLKLLATTPLQHISLYFSGGTACQAPLDDERLVDLYADMAAHLASYGFMQYTTYDFAREGGRSRCQLIYTDHTPYKGFGSAACSFDGEFRSQNYEQESVYIESISRLGTAEQYREVLAPAMRRQESLMFALSSAEGLVLERLFLGGSPAIRESIEQKIGMLSKHGLVRVVNGHLRLTAAGRLVSHTIEAQIIR